MVIGNPRGKISDTNPNGLSKQQMHTMKSILIYESNKNNNIDSNNNNNIDSNDNNNNNNNNNDMQDIWNPGRTVVIIILVNLIQILPVLLWQVLIVQIIILY